MYINNFKISLVKHSNISKDLIDDIIKLKNNHWNYTYEEHKCWIEENINEDEYHLVIQNGDHEIVAYLNMVKTYVEYNSIKEEMIGVGNVCVDKKHLGMGLGELLMNTCNYFLRQLGKGSILICKEHLVNFYEKTGWTRYEGRVYLNEILFQGQIMLKNILNIDKIRLERSF